jgi:hypothetical protein
LIYEEALGKHISENSSMRPPQTGDGMSSWKNLVSDHVASVITQNWNMVEKFSKMKDCTVKIMGMKFPTEGILHC